QFHFDSATDGHSEYPGGERSGLCDYRGGDALQRCGPDLYDGAGECSSGDPDAEPGGANPAGYRAGGSYRCDLQCAGRVPSDVEQSFVHAIDGWAMGKLHGDYPDPGDWNGT